MLKEYEKLLAFVLLGGALVGLAVMIYSFPLVDSTANSGVLQILNMIVGALIGGFGAAANALFRIKDSVTIANAPDEPVPVEETPKPAEPRG